MAGVAATDAQICHQQGQGFCSHGATPVGMKGQLVRLDLLQETRFGDEIFGQTTGLAFGDQPADHVAAEDVEQDVQE